MEKAEAIVSQGFDARMAKTSGLYGAASYFAQEACKALQYGTTIVICRVAIGDPHYTQTTLKSEKRPPKREDQKHRLYDSVVANTSEAHCGAQVHREFCIFADWQVYPEFIVALRCV